MNQPIYYGKKKKNNKHFQYKDSEFTLSVQEVQNIINAPNNLRDSLIIESLYYPALRRSEVCDLMIENIDFERGRMIVQGKFGKISSIPVGSVYPEYLVKLRHHIGKRKSGYVFMSNRNRRLEPTRINQILIEIEKRLQIKNPNPNKVHINPHMFRHSQARRLKSERYAVEFIQKYMRHSSMMTTMDEYGTLSIDEMEFIAQSKKDNKQIIYNP